MRTASHRQMSSIYSTKWSYEQLQKRTFVSPPPDTSRHYSKLATGQIFSITLLDQIRDRPADINLISFP